MGVLTMSIGKKFGRLLVTAHDTEKSTPGRTWVRVICDCGVKKSTRLDALCSGVTVSCGCKKKEHGLKHGYRRVGSSDRTYVSWDSMWQRCTNSSTPQYAAYGGRGIDVDPSWADFRCFLNDMGERPEGRDLDRKDNNLGYSRSNCRWATRKEQMRNTRRVVVVDYGGRKESLRVLAEEVGMNPVLVLQRFNNGWSAEKALTTPNQRGV
jgi:hypothetical protein